MENKEIIKMKSSNYHSLQDAIDQANNYAVIELEAKVYNESIVINKSLTFIGKPETVILLKEHQLLIGGGEVNLEDIHIDIVPCNFDANIMVFEGVLNCKSCTIKALKQHRDLFSCIWIETGRLKVSASTVELYSDFLKIINSDSLELTQNEFTFLGGNLAIETHGLKDIKMNDNQINSDINVIRSTKTVNFIFEDNNINLSSQSNMKPVKLVNIDGLEHGEYCIVSNNKIQTESEAVITISNSMSVTRKIIFSNNELLGNDDSRSIVNFDHLQGLLVVEGNQLLTSRVLFSKCSELLLKQNEIMLFATKQLNLIMADDNQFLQHVMIDGTEHVNFKKNTINNQKTDCEAVRLTGIDKLIFEQNKISSVDHGLTLLNAGDNLEIVIGKNEFVSCRKRAINIASTMQKKYLKTEVKITNNIFVQNEKAIYMDDRNLKSCTVIENYFSDNKDAITVLGGKSTSDIKVFNNYFDASTQNIELRSSQVCKLSQNEFSDSKLSVRGCDEIIINKNRFDKNFNHNSKSMHNDISIKSGGCLTVSQNTMLSGKSRNEKKEVFNHLNITSYDRNPGVNIYDNIPLEGLRKRKLFESNEPVTPGIYPDESLLSSLQYVIHSEQNLSDMKIDDVLKTNFLSLRKALGDIRSDINIDAVKEITTKILDQFQIEIFAERETNDIYRFIVKSNETIEMLKLYSTLKEAIDLSTQERIIAVMNNYLAAFNQFLDKPVENEQDKLNAQLKLLENLL